MISIEFLRQFRFGGYALFDMGVSFIGMYVLSPLLSGMFLRLNVIIPKKSWLLLTLPIGILVHMLVGQNTLMTKNFLDTHGHYVLKLCIMVLLFLGLKNVQTAKK
ncbi:MAG: hypothetical protein NUV65_00615 [Candidatus Roizmanbacteria bacterium]|nr:hypothetical protein [Candidatus Roizmanbacteria bacterium]